MRFRTLSYFVMIVMCILLPLGDGQRRPKPSGKNRCKKFNLENGRVKVKSRGRLAKLSCKKAYTMIEGDRFLSCVRQQWTGALPKCIKSGCEEIHEIAHGESFELFQGALMQFHCDPGYVLNGSPSLACDGNNWNTSIPLCGHRIPHEEVELTCGFEDSGICGWEAVNSPADKGWQREQGGPTMPGSTAPSIDHSTGTEIGYFMLVEASAMGTSAQLFSPIFSTPTEAPTCFVFYYHIQPHAQNSISVSFKPDNISVDSLNNSVILMGDSGRPREDGWTIYYFDLNHFITMEQHFQIIIELLPGEGYNSDVAIDDVALTAGSQCIEYELKYEEQQTPPNTTTLKSTITSLITTEDILFSANLSSTDQNKETVTYQTQSEDWMNITSIITTKGEDPRWCAYLNTSVYCSNPAIDIQCIIMCTDDLQKESLTSLPTTEITQEPYTNISITTANNIIDNNVNQIVTNLNTQTTLSNISYQITTNDESTLLLPDIRTLGPKITLQPPTNPQVITILPPTTSKPFKQRTPEATIQIGANITLNPTTSLLKQNKTKFPTNIPYLSTRTYLSTYLTSLQFSTKISTTAVQNTIISSSPESPSPFTPPLPPDLPPHPFSEISTSTELSTQELISEIRTDSTAFYFQTNSTSHIYKPTSKVSSFISSPATLPSTSISSLTSHINTHKFTPPPSPPLPPHPFSEIMTTTMLTTNKSDVTLNPITSTKNNDSNSYVSTILSDTVQTFSENINNETHISFPKTTALFSQSTFFTDTTTHATSTLSTNEINSQPTTINEVTAATKPSSKPAVTKMFTINTTREIVTTPKSTIDKIITKTSSFSGNSSSTLAPKIVTISNPDSSSSSNVHKTISSDINNKTRKYPKGAIAAIAVLILVLCVLGIITISVVNKKYKEYIKEDKLLEDTEGSNSSFRFSYRREGGGGSKRGIGGGQGEVQLPSVNFYGYENPGTPV